MTAAALPEAHVSRRPEPSILDLNAGFMLAGMATTLLGPIVPSFAERWHLADVTVATLFTMQWVCSTSLTLLSSVLVVRLDAPRVIIAGYALAAAGVLALALVPWPWILVATALYGSGLGLVLPTTNLLVARMNPGHEASAVSLVNVSWSLGAVTWPVIVGLLAQPPSTVRPLGLLAVLLCAIVARLLLSGRTPQAAHDQGAHDQASTTATGSDSIATDASLAQLATFAVLLMLYSGTEASVGGWVAEHVRRLGALHWAASATLFWSAITIGRLSTPFLLGRIGERRVLATALGTAIVGAATLAAAPSAAAALVAVTVTGLGLSPVFPVTFAAVTRDIAPTRPRLVGPLFACTGVGSALLPWLVGVGSTLTGSLRIGLVVPLAGCAALLAIILRRPSRVYPSTRMS